MDTTSDAPRSPRRKYAHPPVIEALARLHWETTAVWSVVTPGTLYERLRHAYPAEPKIQTPLKAEFSSTDSGQQIEFGGTGPRLVFSNEAENQLLIVGAQDVSAHGLPPYEGWESLESRLFDAHEIVSDVLETTGGLSTVGVRYINRVEVPLEDMRFTDYFTVQFAFPVGFPQKLIGFLERSDFIFDDETSRMTFTWASTDAPPERFACILDFDLSAPVSGSGSAEEARTLLSALKLKETFAFEGYIQDKLRELFGVH